MKLEIVAIALMILAIATGGLLLWPKQSDRGVVVEALAGPQPASAPPARGAPR
jgi:hypothetical protein